MNLSLLLGALLLSLWMGISPFQWILIAFRAAVHFQTVSLLLVVVLILIMSRIMKETGHMDRLVASFSRFTTDARMVGSVVTALIGLLPMPGGALFSAPLVETSLVNHDVTREQKTLLNYWFRHVWEYWWPLYPGVVLVVALLEVDTWRYMVAMIPMTFFSVLAGIVFILRPIKRVGPPLVERLTLRDIRSFLWEIMPILIVIIIILFVAGFTGVLNHFGYKIKIPGAVSILPGLLASLLWVCIINRFPFDKFKKAVLDKSLVPLLVLLLAIMIFKSTLIDSQAVHQIRDELVAYNISVILVVMAIPFVSGLVTGVAVGFVGTAFPLIIPMFPAQSLFHYLSFAALAYTFGYMGMMLSPVHLCLLVTKDYYKANLLKSYLLLVPPAVTILLITTILFFVTQVL